MTKKNQPQMVKNTKKQRIITAANLLKSLNLQVEYQLNTPIYHYILNQLVAGLNIEQIRSSLSASALLKTAQQQEMINKHKQEAKIQKERRLTHANKAFSTLKITQKKHLGKEIWSMIMELANHDFTSEKILDQMLNHPIVEESYRVTQLKKEELEHINAKKQKERLRTRVDMRDVLKYLAEKNGTTYIPPEVLSSTQANKNISIQSKPLQLETINFNQDSNNRLSNIKKTRVYCNICNKGFRLEGTLAIHIKKHHSKEENSKQKVNSEVITTSEKQSFPLKSYSCDICNKNFSSVISLNSHKKAKQHGTLSKVELYENISSKQNVIKFTVDNKREKFYEVNEAPIKNKQSSKNLLKLVLPKQLSTSGFHNYNAEAYQLALRTMTSGEAYNLAKDKIKSLSFINKHKRNQIVSMHPDVIEQAEFIDRTVKMRVNQNNFSKRVAQNFNYVCSITGSGQALEAAHIDPIGTGNNNTSNGILMLACLHRLFDSGYMAIDPTLLTIHFSKDCTYFAKDMLEGKVIGTHHVPLNIEGLKAIWKSFKGNNFKTL